MISIRAICVLALLLIFSQRLQAFSGGPPANRNGVTGTYCVACHRTNALNSGDGSVRIVGLPSAWLPGEVYTLRVIVSHPTQRRWGFQMSAIGANGDQAGQFGPAADGRTQVQTTDIAGKTVQFISHTSLGSTIDGPNVFQVTYQTPADASFGTIRFNLAGNAANGNLANSGDFIYATEFMVPLLTLTSERAVALTAQGAVSTETAGAPGALNVGFARMQTSSGSGGTGLSFVDYRSGSILVSGAAFSASTPVRSGRVYAETGTSVNTGLSLLNPSSQPAVVTFSFTDDSGTDFATSTVTIGPNSQLAGFLNQPPFSNPGPRPITDARTFTFVSNVALSTVAVRSRTNERGDFMMTALPVADLAVSSTASIAVPDMADGGGWTSELLLVNTSDASETGTVRFVSPSGQALSVTVDGQTNSQFSYSIPARSSRRLKTSGSAATTATGWVEIAPSGSTRTPSAAGVLTSKASNVTVNETTIVAAPSGNAFRLYAEAAGNFPGGEILSGQTGIAISNGGSTAVIVTIELRNLDGTLAGTPTTLSIDARGQLGLLLSQIAGLGLPTSFTGSVWVSAGSPLSVSGLRARYNERSTPELLVSAFPAFDEASTSTSELLFPQLVDSGGYKTRFVLIGARGGQSAGNLRYSSQGGQSLQLGLR